VPGIKVNILDIHSKVYKIVSVFKFIIVFIYASAVYSSEAEVQRTVMNFFKNINERHYERAYAFFSDAVKHEVPFPRFRARAGEIRKVIPLSMVMYESDRYLTKMKVKAKITMKYKGKLYNALYGGTCDLQVEKGHWKVASVDLKPLEQKQVLEKSTIQFSR